jgi:DNA-binding NtrC family response regulator
MKGRFREDLFHRLNVVSIRIPSLSERPEDIPLLAAHFLEKFAPVRVVSGFSPEAHRLLLAYSWPGNVRELRNAVERALIIGTSEFILPEDLPDWLLEGIPIEGTQIRGLQEDVNDLKKARVQGALLKTGNAGLKRPLVCRYERPRSVLESWRQVIDFPFSR